MFRLVFPNLNINCLSNWQLFKSFLDFQEKIPPCSLKDQSSAKTAVGSKGIFTSESPESGPSRSDSLEEVCSTLRANLDRVFELSSMTQKEVLHMRSQLQNLTIKRENEAKEANQMVLKFNELSAKRETEIKEAQDVALKLKKLSENHKTLTGRVNFVETENDKLARVLFYFVFNF